jgi:hypothetical protein
MSITGIPSVMTMISGTPASAASRIASPANGGGTKMTLTLAPVCFTALATVSKIGIRSWNSVPPFPGVTPATSFVP